MYPVSDAYLERIKSDSIAMDWRGTLTTKDNLHYDFDSEAIVEGTLSITHEISSDSTIELGTAYTSEIKISLYMQLDRYILYDGTIQIEFGLELEDGTYEWIPSNTYYITEATRTGDFIAITGYDAMSKMDKMATSQFTDMTPYEIMESCCENTGVELGNTEEEFENFINGTDYVSEYVTDDESTKSYSAILQAVSQMMGGYVTIDNDKLYFRQYKMDADRVYGDDDRFSLEMADYESWYSGMTYTKIRDNKVEVLGDTEGLVYNIGTNTFMQYGLDEALLAKYQAIFDSITTYVFTPFTATLTIDPSLRVGDIVSFTGNGVVSGKVAPVTSITYKSSGTMEIKCGGENPKLKDKSGNLSETTQYLLNSANENKIVYYNFENHEELICGDNEEIELFNISFITSSATQLILQGEILLDVETTEITDGDTYTVGDAVARVRYVYDNDEIEGFYPTEAYQDGKHILNLFYPLIPNKDVESHRFIGYLSMSGGNASIEEYNSKTMVYGQGLYASSKPWDGTITIEESISSIVTTRTDVYTMSPITDTAEISPIEPYSSAINETISGIRVTFSQFTMSGIYDTVSTSGIVSSFTMDSRPDHIGTYDSDFVEINTNNQYHLKEAFSYSGVAQSIDDGSLTVATIDTSVFASIESIEET
jgi:hypothetical protein